MFVALVWLTGRCTAVVHFKSSLSLPHHRTYFWTCYLYTVLLPTWTSITGTFKVFYHTNPDQCNLCLWCKVVTLLIVLPFRVILLFGDASLNTPTEFRLSEATASGQLLCFSGANACVLMAADSNALVCATEDSSWLTLGNMHLTNILACMHWNRILLQDYLLTLSSKKKQ